GATPLGAKVGSRPPARLDSPHGIAATRALGPENVRVAAVAVLESAPPRRPVRASKHSGARRAVVMASARGAGLAALLIAVVSTQSSRPSVALAMPSPGVSSAQAPIATSPPSRPVPPAPSTRQSEQPATAPTPLTGDLAKYREARRFTGHTAAVNAVA